jgi:hypothetical protein
MQRLGLTSHAGAMYACRKILLNAAGFRFTRLILTRGVFSLVEAVPAALPKHVESSNGSQSSDVHINVKWRHLKEHGVIKVNLNLESEE